MQIKASWEQAKTHSVGDGVQARDPLNISVRNSRSTEDFGCIDGDTCDTNPLLHDLEPDDKLDATTGMKLS